MFRVLTPIIRSSYEAMFVVKIHKHHYFLEALAGEGVDYSVVIATNHGMDLSGFIPRWEQDFHSHPSRPVPGCTRGSTVIKVLCYKSEGCWFDPSYCQWIFH